MDERRTIGLEPEAAIQPPLLRRPVPGRRARPLIIPAITFLLGVVFGVVFIVLCVLSLSGNLQMLAAVPPPQTSDIHVQVGPAYITHVVEKGLRSTGIGAVSNVTVTLARGDQMTVNGDDQVLFGLTRPFTIVVQPLVSACQLKIHVLHAEISGISLTGFVRKFEGQIDRQLTNKPSNLPAGFAYCQTSVSTQPQGLYLTYSAQPI